MDQRIMAYMWREMNDQFYRIQTNSPQLIRKLKKRTTTTLCGYTLKGSTEYWLIFLLKYNKPSTARQGFQRLTGQNEIKVDEDGVFTTEMVDILDLNTKGESTSDE